MGSHPQACHSTPSPLFSAHSRCCLEGTSRKSSAQLGSEHKEVTRSSGCWPKAGLKMMSLQSTPTCHIYCNINMLNGNSSDHTISSWVIAEIGVRILAAQRLTLLKAGGVAPHRRSLSITRFQSPPHSSLQLRGAERNLCLRIASASHSAVPGTAYPPSIFNFSED